MDHPSVESVGDEGTVSSVYHLGCFSEMIYVVFMTLCMLLYRTSCLARSLQLAKMAMLKFPRRDH